MDPYPSAKVVPYDPGWMAQYRAVADGLRGGLGDGWLIEHVGSTSVPLLPAKPVIDLALRIPIGVELPVVEANFASLGWTGPEEVGDHHAVFLLNGDGIRQAIGHLFPVEQWPTAHVRMFAQWLRGHPEDRDAYAALKTGLVGAGVWGPDYTEAKTDFVRDVVNRAQAAWGNLSDSGAEGSPYVPNTPQSGRGNG